MAVQFAMEEEELSSGICFIIFIQALGPANTLTLFNVLFLSTLRSQITQQTPLVGPTDTIKVDTTWFQSLVTFTDLPKLLVAYSNSISHVFYLAAALTST